LKKNCHTASRLYVLTAFSIASAFLLALTGVLTLRAPEAATAAPASGGIAVATDKLVYHPGDSVNFSLSLDPGGRAFDGELTVRVYPAAAYTDATAFATAPMSETSLVKDYSISGPGAATASVSLEDLKVGPGGYPIRVSLMSGGQEVLYGTNWLAIVDPAGQEPLDLALLWTAGSPPQRDDEGQFISSALIDRCRAEPRAADTLLQHRDLSQKFPGVKTSYAVESSLFEQLEALADGFDLVQGDQTVSYAADSPEAGAASSCLASFRDLSVSTNTEFLSAPYFFANLPLLAKQGWDDGNGQYRIGQDALGEALGIPAPMGAYAAGLDLTTDSLRYLAATGGDFTVLPNAARASLEGRLAPGLNSYRIRDLSGERITGFFANDDASTALFSDAPEPAAFFAALANAYVSGAPRLQIAASPVPNPALGEAQRQQVYATIEQEPWLRSITLSEARDKYRPETQPVTLMRYLDPASGYLAQTYYQKLDATHERFEDLRVAVDNAVPEIMRLTREMYTAESVYYISSGVSPEAANQGLAWLEAIDADTGEQLSRLEVDVDTPFLQGGSDGIATVTLVNNNPYVFNATLSLSGEGVEFPDGPDQTLQLEPGIKEIQAPYHSEGWSGVEARLTSRGNTIAADSAGIHLITARAWFVILFALAAIIGAATYIIVVTRQRRGL